MASEFHVTDRRALAEEQPLPDALSLGRADLDDHWESLQSEQAFETVRTKSCSILTNTITTAGILLAISGVFITTGSPVPYFDYASPVPHCLLFLSLMLSVIAILTSGSSMIRWLHADRHWTQEQLKSGNCFVWLYLLSIVTPMFFVAWSLHCFIFAMLITGFSSQSVICRVVTAVWLVAYVVNIGTILMKTMWRYAASLDRARYR